MAPRVASLCHVPAYTYTFPGERNGGVGDHVGTLSSAGGGGKALGVISFLLSLATSRISTKKKLNAGSTAARAGSLAPWLLSVRC